MALKQSPQMKRRYPGNLGEHDLKQALDLLFLIKGKSYKKKSPDFINPTADEFFTFCKFVSEEMYLHKTNTKKLLRSLSSDKLNHLNHLDFFESIVQTKSETLNDRITLCLNIVFFALFVYFFTGISMKASIVDEKASESALSYKQFFIHPLNWFCVHVMPSLEKNKKEIIFNCFDMYHLNIQKLLDFENIDVNKSFYKTAQMFSDIFDETIVEEGLLIRGASAPFQIPHQ